MANFGAFTGLRLAFAVLLLTHATYRVAVRITIAAVRRANAHHHGVYVILLSREVLREPKFKRCNPEYHSGKPCVYVGMTGLSPDDRFDKHKAGIRSNRFVRLYGVRLVPELYECYNPMPYEAAKDMEVELAIGLREEGYGVWQG